MLTTSYSDFTKDVNHYVDSVIDNFETLIINKGKDNGIVIMSLAEYNSQNATRHELSSKANKERLDSAIMKFENKQSFQKELLEI